MVYGQPQNYYFFYDLQSPAVGIWSLSIETDCGEQHPSLRGSPLQRLLFSFEETIVSSNVSQGWSNFIGVKVSLFGFHSIVSKFERPQESPCGLGLLIYKLPLPGGVTVEPAGKITSL